MPLANTSVIQLAKLYWQDRNSERASFEIQFRISYVVSEWTGSRREQVWRRKGESMSTREKAIGRRSLLSMGAAAAGLGLFADLEAYPQNVNRNSIPSDLKITDMRIAVLRGPGGQAGGGRGGGRGGIRGP